MTMRIFLLSGVCCCSSLLADDALPQTYQPRVGQPHPDFVLPNIETGEPVSLSQYRGKKVLLIHFASW